MNRISKKKTLSRYIIKKYLSFLIVILLLFSLIRNLSALLFFGSDNLNFSRILAYHRGLRKHRHLRTRGHRWLDRDSG